MSVEINLTTQYILSCTMKLSKYAMFNENERTSLRIYYNRSDCTDLYHNRKTFFPFCVKDYYNDNFDAKKKKDKVFL